LVTVSSSEFFLIKRADHHQRFAGFIASFSEEKLSFNLTTAVKYFSAAVTAQCPRHVFGGNSHGPNDFRFLLSYSYKSCIF